MEPAAVAEAKKTEQQGNKKILPFGKRIGDGACCCYIAMEKVDAAEGIFFIT